MKQELFNNLNQYLANVGVLYVKLHNLHWNVVGPQFKSLHEYLEVLYDGFADVLDDTAEVIKMHGLYPLASMKDYLAVATVEELESKNYSVEEVVNIVTSDIALMQSAALAIRAEAGEADAYGIVSLMEDHLKNYDKTLWFLRSMVL